MHWTGWLAANVLQRKERERAQRRRKRNRIQMRKQMMNKSRIESERCNDISERRHFTSLLLWLVSFCSLLAGLAACILCICSAPSTFYGLSLVPLSLSSWYILFINIFRLIFVFGSVCLALLVFNCVCLCVEWKLKREKRKNDSCIFPFNNAHETRGKKNPEESFVLFLELTEFARRTEGNNSRRIK